MKPECLTKTEYNAKLLKWTSLPENQPPQEWWDETGDPFVSETRCCDCRHWESSSGMCTWSPKFKGDCIHYVARDQAMPEKTVPLGEVPVGRFARSLATGSRLFVVEHLGIESRVLFWPRDAPDSLGCVVTGNKQPVIDLDFGLPRFGPSEAEKVLDEYELSAGRLRELLGAAERCRCATHLVGTTPSIQHARARAVDELVGIAAKLRERPKPPSDKDGPVEAGGFSEADELVDEFGGIDRVRTILGFADQVAKKALLDERIRVAKGGKQSDPSPDKEGPCEVTARALTSEERVVYDYAENPASLRVLLCTLTEWSRNEVSNHVLLRQIHKTFPLPPREEPEESRTDAGGRGLTVDVSRPSEWDKATRDTVHFQFKPGDRVKHVGGSGPYVVGDRKVIEPGITMALAIGKNYPHGRWYYEDKLELCPEEPKK